MKTIWLTSVIPSEERVKNLIAQLKPYGLDVKGHFWEDEISKMTWAKPREELIKPDVLLWLILASGEQLKSPSVRYGLSLLALTLQAKRGISFPMLILQTDGETPPAETLPTPLRGSNFLSLTDPAMAAKLVVKVNTPVKEILSEYRLDTYGNPHIGQWIEVGPCKGPWPGAMFGVSGAEITFHAVGPKGSLPTLSSLRYPLKGMKLNLGGKEYTAWAAQNELNSDTSYFVKIEGFPESILFGPYSTEEEAEAFVVQLK
ncbi:MAG: hypothetical protein A2V86_01815 [Deltaproteobacteria bacterium RBG_16_49_23]|nr:MAG: hypothetical protein A2V86_01815 [Deltaproteobacteria bacterium RBG_16_49_23]